MHNEWLLGSFFSDKSSSNDVGTKKMRKSEMKNSKKLKCERTFFSSLNDFLNLLPNSQPRLSVNFLKAD